MLDLLRDSPIIEIKGNEFVGLEGDKYIEAAYLRTNIDKKAIQNLYYHYMGGNEIKKSSILAIPLVYKCGIVIQPWRKGHNKKQDTRVMAAPISINGTKYICCIVTERNKKIEYPYAIRLFDLKQIEELICNNIVRDGSETTSLSSDKAKSNPLTVAKVLQKYLIVKKNEENNAFAPYRDDLRHAQNYQNGWGNTSQAEINWWKTKGIGDSIIRKGKIIENKQYNTRYNMNKKLIRLTESDLHRIVKESVNRVLKESFDVSRFGDDTFEQIDNMQFTDAQKMILNYALKLEERGFSDEEYYELAFFFAKHNGLNESRRVFQKKN